MKLKNLFLFVLLSCSFLVNAQDNRIGIKEQIQKSSVPGSLVASDVSNEQYYLPPGAETGVLTIQAGVPTWIVGGGGEQTTVTDQVNGLDINLTGFDITINTNIPELSMVGSIDKGVDYLYVYDGSAADIRKASVQQIAESFDWQDLSDVPAYPTGTIYDYILVRNDASDINEWKQDFGSFYGIDGELQDNRTLVSDDKTMFWNFSTGTYSSYYNWSKNYFAVTIDNSGGSGDYSYFDVNEHELTYSGYYALSGDSYSHDIGNSQIYWQYNDVLSGNTTNVQYGSNSLNGGIKISNQQFSNREAKIEIEAYDRVALIMEEANNTGTVGMYKNGNDAEFRIFSKAVEDATATVGQVWTLADAATGSGEWQDSGGGGGGLWIADANGITPDPNTTNVGIGGASNAGYDLQVHGAASRIQNTIFQLVGSDQYIQNGSGGDLIFRTTSVDQNYLVSLNSTAGGGYSTTMLLNSLNQTFQVNLDGSPRLFINSDGDTGVNTSTPSGKNHVYGRGGTQNVVQVLESGDAVAYNQIWTTTTGNASTNDGTTFGVNGSNFYIQNREAGASINLNTEDSNTFRIEGDGDVAVYNSDDLTVGLFWDASVGGLSIGNGTFDASGALDVTGEVFFDTYASGVAGTAVYNILVDASGKLITGAVTGIGGIYDGDGDLSEDTQVDFQGFDLVLGFGETHYLDMQSNTSAELKYLSGGANSRIGIDIGGSIDMYVISGTGFNNYTNTSAGKTHAVNDGTNQANDNITPTLITMQVVGSSTTGTVTVDDNGIEMLSAVQMSGILSPAAITADVDNYSPSGLDAVYVLELDADASYNWGGLNSSFAGDGWKILLVNTSGFDQTLEDEATSSSSAANQFRCPNNVNYTLLKDGSVEVIYLNSRWQLISK